MSTYLRDASLESHLPHPGKGLPKPRLLLRQGDPDVPFSTFPETVPGGGDDAGLLQQMRAEGCRCVPLRNGNPHVERAPGFDRVKAARPKPRHEDVTTVLVGPPGAVDNHLAARDLVA